MTSRSSTSFARRRPAPQLLELERLLQRHASPRRFVVGEVHVVMSTELGKCGPLVAEQRREAAAVAIAPDRIDQALPLQVVHPHVVLGERQEVEPRHVATELVVAVRRALTLGEAGVTVSVAPEHAPPRTCFSTHIGLPPPRSRPSALRTSKRCTPGASRAARPRSCGARGCRPAPSRILRRRAAARTRVSSRSRGSSIDPRCESRRKTARRARPRTAGAPSRAGSRRRRGPRATATSGVHASPRPSKSRLTARMSRSFE